MLQQGNNFGLTGGAPNSPMARKLGGAAGPDNGGGFPAPPYLQWRPNNNPAVSQGATGLGDKVQPSTQQPGGLQKVEGATLNGKTPQAGVAASAPLPTSAPAPGTDGQTVPPAQPPRETLSNLGGAVENQLNNPSAFNSDVVKQSYDYMKGDLEKTRDQGLANADTDAASRGVYYGTPGMASRERVTTDYNRGLGGLASNLAIAQAQQYGQDRQNAMGNAFQFLGNANQQEQQDQQMAALAAELGMQGAPSYGTAVGMPMPTPQYGGIDPQALQALGALLGGGTQPGQKKQAPPAAQGDNNVNNVG